MTSSFLGGPGFLAFVATAVLVIATVLLARSLSRHLRKVRTHPPDQAAEPGESGTLDAPGAPKLPPPARSAGVEEDDGARGEVTGEPGDR